MVVTFLTSLPEKAMLISGENKKYCKSINKTVACLFEYSLNQNNPMLISRGEKALQKYSETVALACLSIHPQTRPA